MTNINLEENQVQLLNEILESKVADLGYEIRNTATYNFRQQLKERRDELNKIHDILQKPH